MDPKDVLVTQRPTNNPYIHAAKLIWRRIYWDLNAASWISRQRLNQLQNRYRGQRAVILCNGPSLLRSDLSLLHNTFTFGLNKINLLFAKSDFRPSCVVSVNASVVEQNAAFFQTTDIPLFLTYRGLRYVASRPNICYLHSTSHREFAKDCSVSVYESCTVTFVALQLAFHMGFRRVALIGADHNFQTQGPANKWVTSGDRDENHFDPNYFAGGMKWQLPDLFESEVGYTMARRMFEAYDGEVVNATVGGSLDVFPRMPLERFLTQDCN
jgi:hypothetical protein